MTVVVNKGNILEAAECYIGSTARQMYLNNTWTGISNSKLTKNIMMAEMLSDALSKECGDQELICELLMNLTKHCKDCKPVNRTGVCVSVDEEAYETYINSDEYLACLNAEFEEKGYISCIEPGIDLCKNMSVEIDADKVCNLIVAGIAASGGNCDVLASISAGAVCDTFAEVLDSASSPEEALAQVVLDFTITTK